MKLLGALPGSEGEADALRRRRQEGCGAVRQRAGHRLRQRIPAAAAIVPPPGRVTGSGRRSSSIPRRTTRSARSTAPGNRARPSRGRPVRDRRLSTARCALHHRWLFGAARSRSSCGRSRFAAPSGVGAGTRGPAAAHRRLRAWAGSMDEGWTRWVLEQYGFAFVTIRPEDFKRPLADKIDVADHGRRCARAAGAAAEARPPARARGGARSSGPPRVRDISSRPTICSAFDQFVRGGGTLVCLSNASTFAIQQLKLPVKKRRRRPAAGRVLPARLDRRSDDRSHAPCDGGMPDEGGRLRRRQSGVRDAGRVSRARCWRNTRDTGSPLRSGYLIGEKYLNGKAAALDVRVDAGHVVLLGFRPDMARPAVRLVPRAVQRGAGR